jgi:hypothetical protein
MSYTKYISQTGLVDRTRKMNEIQTASSKILRKYEVAADEAYEDWKFACKYGKKAEQAEKKTAYKIADAILVAVDEALYDLRAVIEGVDA